MVGRPVGLLPNMALIDDLARAQQKFLFFKLDSFLILAVYFEGLESLYLPVIGT